MNNLARTIEDRFARSVRDRVHLQCKSLRSSGGARQYIQATLTLDRVLVLQTHGTAACAGIWPTSGSTFDSEQKQEELNSDRLLYMALTTYAALSLDEILNSRNPIVRGLGMLDSRVGKQRLSKFNVRHEPILVQRMFRFRCQCEGLPVVQSAHATTTLLQAKHARESAKTDPEEQARRILSQRKRSQDMRAFLAALEKGAVPGDANSVVAQAFMKCVTEKKKRASYVRYLKLLLHNSKLVNDRYLLGLTELFRNTLAWVRPIEEWKPRTHNPDRQFSSLARHLFATYDVPTFMDKAWLTGNSLHQAWFQHIGAGGNIRTAEGLPVPLTKMMAHHFLSCPEHYSIESAFRWGQALALGADRQMADAIVQTRLSEQFYDNDFWFTVIAFFGRNPMLDPVHIGPIVDYIWNQKYADVMEFVERGLVRNRGPLQPNFTMKGRTVNSLLQQVTRWHQGLGKTKSDLRLSWTKSTVHDFEFIEGSAEHKNMRIWRIVELLSSRQLIEEGRQMRHCVASYANSCRSGDSGIWSMAVQSKEGVAKVLTIQVRLALQPKVICQVRGKMNRMPTAKEREIVQRWASTEKLQYS